MRGFLIDVNLPYRFSLWSGEDFEHMRDVGEAWTDTQIWRYAQERDLGSVDIRRARSTPRR